MAYLTVVYAVYRLYGSAVSIGCLAPDLLPGMYTQLAYSLYIEDTHSVCIDVYELYLRNVMLMSICDYVEYLPSQWCIYTVRDLG